MTNPLDRVHERLLVLRTQLGDQRAFEELIDRYHERLRRFLGKLLAGPAHDADDVLQDVWFDVWRSISRLEDADALPIWLFRIARDRAYRVLRRKGAKPRPLGGEEPHVDVETSLEADERELLHASLAELPHEHREVLILRFMEEMSYEQIAAAVGCAVGTVRSRLHYAKLALRQLLTKRKSP